MSNVVPFRPSSPVVVVELVLGKWLINRLETTGRRAFVNSTHDCGSAWVYATDYAAAAGFRVVACPHERAWLGALLACTSC